MVRKAAGERFDGLRNGQGIGAVWLLSLACDTPLGLLCKRARFLHALLIAATNYNEELAMLYMVRIAWTRSAG